MKNQPRVRTIAAAFTVSAVASIGLMVVYLYGGQPQLEGMLIAVALGGIGVGLVLWAKDLMPGGDAEEAKESHSSSPEERGELVDEMFPEEHDPGRRRFLARLLAFAGGALGLAALFPIRSLGSEPGEDLLHTEWTEGARLFTADGTAVAVDTLEVGGILTVFPEDAIGSADSQTVLIRVDPGDLRLSDDQLEGTFDGYVAYSKICTHAGCPVGLYEPETYELFCPCHQSVFDVVAGAVPTGGPATTPLPQLPVGTDPDGNLVALGDFPEPVGPLFWRRDRD